jgi:tetratricopeptide (TPR) repeat protein
MWKRHLVIAAAAITFSVPAAAGVTVIGSSSARMCYLAAEAGVLPTLEDLSRCDTAIAEVRDTRTHLVATHVNRGIVRMRRGDIPGALRDFDQASALNPNEPEAYFNRGSALLRSEQAGEAVTMFTQAIQLSTRRPAQAFYARGVANEVLGNLRAAYADYQQASQLAPDWQPPRRELRRFRVSSR